MDFHYHESQQVLLVMRAWMVSSCAVECLNSLIFVDLSVV